MAVFASDTFTDTNGTALGSHTSDVGSGWSGGDTANLDIQSNKASPYTGTGPLIGLNATTPASNEYDVEVDVQYTGTYHGAATPGVCGRWTLAWSNGTGYRAYIYNSVLYLLRVASGSETTLGSYALSDPGAGVDVALKLEIRDAAKKVYVGGVERISSADNTHTQTGGAGFALRGTGGGPLWRADNFVATDVAAGGTTAVYYMHQQTVAA